MQVLLHTKNKSHFYTLSENRLNVATEYDTLYVFEILLIFSHFIFLAFFLSVLVLSVLD